MQTIVNGDIDKLREIVTSQDIHRIPFSPGFNSAIQSEDFMSWSEMAEYFYWSALVHMLWQRATTEEKMIETIKFVKDCSFFNIR